MPKYIIERELEGAGNLGNDQLQGISQKSCQVLTEFGPKIQWLESYVTDDKIYCVYIAPDKEILLKHAEMGGFPANEISQVRRIIDPTSAWFRVGAPIRSALRRLVVSACFWRWPSSFLQWVCASSC